MRVRPRGALRGALENALCAVLLWWPLLLSASVLQLPWPRALGDADGLPTPEIRAVAEDATGYLWLASSDGLLRFDGQRFRTLHQAEGLPDADLLDVHIDPADRIWLATATQGLVVLGADRITFERPDASAPAGVRSGRIKQVNSDKLGRIWVIGDDDDVYVQEATAQGWQRQRLGGDAVRQVEVDRDGVVWAITDTRLWRRDGRVFRALSLSPATLPPMQSMWVDPMGGIEVTASGRTWVLDPVGRVVAGPRRARTLLRSADGVTWQQSGADLHWQLRGQSKPVGIRPDMRDGQQPVQIRQLLQDRHGDLWWVSERRGLWWLPAHWRQFTLLPTLGRGMPEHGIHPVRALAASGRDHVWVAGADGLLQRADLRNGETSHPVTFAPAHEHPASVALAEDGQGRVWLARPGQLLRYDPASRATRRWSLQDPQQPAPYSLQVCERNLVWLAAGDTIQRWSEGGTALRASAEQLGLRSTTQGRQLLCTGDGGIWATDAQGLMRWNEARGRFLRFGPTSGGAAIALAEADDGTLWVTRDAALEQYRVHSPSLQPLQRVSLDQGYPALRAASLAVDPAGVVWAGATRGLVRFDPGTGEVRLLDVAQGLPAQEVLPRRLVKLGSGALVAAVREGGLLAFDPAVLPLPPAVPVLVVEAMSRCRHDRMMTIPLADGTVSLSTADRNIRVAVSLLGRGDPDRTRHRFRLLGQDPAWVDTGPVPQRLFARLPAGDHVLLIQARHAGGPWSAVRELHLRVVPRWWQTPLGRSVLGLLATTLLIALGRCFHAHQARRQARRQARDRRDMAELESLDRTRFLARLGRQIRMPMTPVLGWSELLLQSSLSPAQRTQVGSLYQAGHHLLQLTDEALDVASIEANQLQRVTSPFDLGLLLDELNALLLPLAQAKAISLHLSNELLPGQMPLGDVQRLRQILLNLLGNALKFTVRGQVALSVAAGGGGQGLVVCVADTGPGMSAAQLARLFQRFTQADDANTLAQYGGSGLGLAICRDLAQAMGGGIEADSEPGRGTRMTVTLPWQLVFRSSATPVQPMPSGDLRSLRVMVLLPSASVADVVCALLRSSGHRVVGVDDVDSWLVNVDAGPWDLIAADPDMLVGGERLSARLPWLWPGVPRLALSARADACAERETLAAGFDLFLRLPLTAQRLDAVLRRCRRN